MAADWVCQMSARMGDKPMEKRFLRENRQFRTPWIKQAAWRMSEFAGLVSGISIIADGSDHCIIKMAEFDSEAGQFNIVFNLQFGVQAVTVGVHRFIA